MILQTCSFCDIGLERETNQDHIFCGADGENILAAVADGMGGHEHGEKASGMICDMLRDWWRASREEERRPSFQDMACELEAVIEKCNTEIFESVSGSEICGSTLIVLWIAEGRWMLFSAGDSRCYLMKKMFFGTCFKRLSQDDVWENQTENKRKYTRKERKNHPNYGNLTKAVGVDGIISCEKREGKLRKKSVFFLCSDGVYRYCGEDILKKALGDVLRGENMKLCLDEIYQSVYQHGAPDNLSGVAVYIE